MKILGDEVQALFLGYYMEISYPKFTSADKYITDPVTREVEKKIQEIKKKRGKFVYMDY
jgi:hypothetical protein